MLATDKNADTKSTSRQTGRDKVIFVLLQAFPTVQKKCVSDKQLKPKSIWKTFPNMTKLGNTH